jgi:hypothetical protein
VSVDIGRLRAAHDKFLKAHAAMVAGELYNAGNVAMAEVIRHPGFKPRTGGLQKATSFRVLKTSGGKVVRLKNTKSYAHPIESGSRPHRIVAKNGRALRFLGRDGNYVFRRAVNHPGNRPYWFLNRANGPRRPQRSRAGEETTGMKLSFVPRRDCVPKWPGKGQGTYPYIGRTFDPATRKNVADKEPAKVVAYNAAGKLTEEARRCVFDFCKRDGDLLPADGDTAQFCGVPFVPIKRANDGEWDQVPAAPPKKAE